MGICNANYEFLLADIGDSGSNGDGWVLANGNMGIVMNEHNLRISFKSL